MLLPYDTTGAPRCDRPLLALPARPSLSPRRQAQTLRIALREDADILDPTLARTYVGRIVFAGLCDKLFDIDDKLQIVPQLATGYEYDRPQDPGDPPAPRREVP